LTTRFKLALALAALLFALPAARAADDGADNEPDPTDALGRAKQRGLLTACADPFEFPHAQESGDPPGFDVELMRAIAKRGGMRLSMVWVNTASRGGTSRAFRQSILARKCDVFLGLSDNGDDDMLMNKLVFTKAYLGTGYVLVTQGKAAQRRSLEEFKEGEMRVGVSMSTPMDDYLFMNKIPRELYLGSKRMMDALSKGDIDAAMVFSTQLGMVPVDYPKASFRMVDGYQPIEGLRYNAAWVVRKEEKPLLRFINEGIDELLSSGKVKDIVERYGVPFYPPFNS
jgi:ABC-type amino acid transport substrate-binding protein